MTEVNLKVRFSLAISLQKLPTPWRHKRQNGWKVGSLNPLEELAKIVNSAGAHSELVFLHILHARQTDTRFASKLMKLPVEKM